MKITRREAIKAAAATAILAATIAACPTDWPPTVMIEGVEYKFDREMTTRPNEVYGIYYRIAHGRPPLLPNSIDCVYGKQGEMTYAHGFYEPLEDVKIRLRVGITKEGKFVPQPSLIEHQRVLAKSEKTGEVRQIEI